MTDKPVGPEALATVRFTERYECRSSKTNSLEVFEADEVFGQVMLDLEGPSMDPRSARAVWLSERPSDVCHDWVRIPGSVVEIIDLQQWSAPEPPEGPVSNVLLAARARDLAARAELGSDERKAALCAAVCLFTTSSITAARKALVQIEDEQLRQAAADIIDQLANGSDENDV